MLEVGVPDVDAEAEPAAAEEDAEAEAVVAGATNWPNAPPARMTGTRNDRILSSAAFRWFWRS